MLRYVSIAYWVFDFIGAFLLRVLCVGGSYVSFFIMFWAASYGYRRGVSGCYTLGGGATLGSVTFQGRWVVGMRLQR